MRIGVTGNTGFIGQHLVYRLTSGTYSLVPFHRGFFTSLPDMLNFVSESDVIVHLAADIRNPNPEELYENNINMARMLCEAIELSGNRPFMIYASSIQETENNAYGRSKRDVFRILSGYADRCGFALSGLIIPNVFGPFCRPFHNSFISTFCHQLIHGEMIEITGNKTVPLIYIDSLCSQIVSLCEQYGKEPVIKTDKNKIAPDFTATVLDTLRKLMKCQRSYLTERKIPELRSIHDYHLFVTLATLYGPLSTYTKPTNAGKSINLQIGEIPVLGCSSLTAIVCKEPVTLNFRSLFDSKKYIFQLDGNLRNTLFIPFPFRGTAKINDKSARIHLVEYDMEPGSHPGQCPPL